MFAYRVYGMRVRSDLELPELSPGPSDSSFDVDITVRNDGTPKRVHESEFSFSPERQVFAYPGLGTFVITGLSQISIDPEPGVSPAILAFPLLGPVMALLLHLRGRFVLHASAIELGGVGIAFMGDKGAGKSTTAATVLRQPKTTLLSDDLVAFDDDGRILPGFPQLKLASDALAEFKGVDATLRPAPVEDFPKHQLRLAGDAPERATTVGALYEIHRGTDMRVETLTPSEALKTLYRFSYIGRFASRPFGNGEQRRLLQQVGQIVNQVGVKRLYVPDTLERLPLVCDFLSVEHGRR